MLITWISYFILVFIFLECPSWRSPKALQTSLICLKESEDASLSLWKHPLCFHGGHQISRAFITNGESAWAETASKRAIQSSAGSEGFPQRCSCSAVLHILQLIPRQHGFPVRLCFISQLLKVKSCLPMSPLSRDLFTYRPRFCASAWLSLSQSLLLIQSKAVLPNLIWWTHYTV